MPINANITTTIVQRAAQLASPPEILLRAASTHYVSLLHSATVQPIARERSSCHSIKINNDILAARKFANRCSSDESIAHLAARETT